MKISIYNIPVERNGESIIIPEISAAVFRESQYQSGPVSTYVDDIKIVTNNKKKLELIGDLSDTEIEMIQNYFIKEI